MCGGPEEPPSAGWGCVCYYGISVLVKGDVPFCCVSGFSHIYPLPRGNKTRTPCTRFSSGLHALEPNRISYHFVRTLFDRLLSVAQSHRCCLTSAPQRMLEREV